METLTQREFDVLLKEYELVQTRIKDFDVLLFQVKGWSITIFSTIIGFSIVNKQDELLILPIFTTMMFWLVEAMFKYFQKRVVYRLRCIEKIINENDYEGQIADLSSFHIPEPFTFKQKVLKLFQCGFEYNVAVLYSAQFALLAIMGVIAI